MHSNEHDCTHPSILAYILVPCHKFCWTVKMMSDFFFQLNKIKLTDTGWLQWDLYTAICHFKSATYFSFSLTLTNRDPLHVMSQGQTVPPLGSKEALLMPFNCAKNFQFFTSRWGFYARGLLLMLQKKCNHARKVQQSLNAFQAIANNWQTN